MPQLFMIIGKKAQGQGLDLEEIGQALIKTVEEVFDLEGKNDVAFTAVNAAHTISEQPIQVEVRYTAGEDEYKRGKPFDPPESQRRMLADAINNRLKELLPPRINSSTWVKPYYHSTFKM
jgi:hypothetical protein